MSFLKHIVYPFWKFLVILFPAKMSKLKYRIITGKKLNLKNPLTFNEKLQWLKVYRYHHNPLVTQCVDKYEVRKFIESKGCEEILVPLIGCYDKVSDVPWNDLPNKFAIKCNHGCGFNIICDDKEKFDVSRAKKLLNKWMRSSYGYSNVELVYEDIKRKIIIEQFIETSDKLPPKDYKIFCSYGEPKLMYVASDRFDGNVKFDYYTPEWDWIPVKNNHPNAGVVKKPSFLNEMLDYAKKLSEDFPMVRVDLYCEDNKILFGELTFLHYGGVVEFDPDEYDRKFGDLFPLDKEVNKK